MYSVYRESVVRKSVSAWQHWAVGSRRLLISLYNCIQAPAPGGHHQPLPSLANTGPGWIKLCGYSRRYRAGPHHQREPWGQARTRQRSLLIRSQSVSVVTMFHDLKIMPSFSHFPFDLTRIFDFLSIAISQQVQFNLQPTGR